MDDVEREESEEQRKQDEEKEFGASRHTHDPRQTFHSWCRHGIREEDERRTVSNQLGKERDESQRSIWTEFSRATRRNDNIGILVARQRATRAVLSTVVPRRSKGE